MLDQVFAIAGGAFLLGAIVLAVRVDRDEARLAAGARPWAPVRPPEFRRSRPRLRLLR